MRDPTKQPNQLIPLKMRDNFHKNGSKKMDRLLKKMKCIEIFPDRHTVIP